MEYVNQSPDGLTFTHFVGPEAVATLDESVLTVLKRQNHVLCGLKVEAAIIGESHLVRIRGPDIELVELLACVDIREYGFHPTHWARNILPSHRWQGQFGPWHLDANVWIRRLVDDAVRATLVPPAATLPRICLVHSFPGPLSPRTIVVVSELVDTLTINTFHEYSNTGQGVDIVCSKTSLSSKETER